MQKTKGQKQKQEKKKIKKRTGQMDNRLFPYQYDARFREHFIRTDKVVCSYHQLSYVLALVTLSLFLKFCFEGHPKIGLDVTSSSYHVLFPNYVVLGSLLDTFHSVSHVFIGKLYGLLYFLKILRGAHSTLCLNNFLHATSMPGCVIGP